MSGNQFGAEREGSELNHTGGFWRGARRATTFLAIFVAIFPSALVAQNGLPAVGGAAQAAVFGAGAQAPLQFAGQTEALNQVTFMVGASTLYDDNILANNKIRRGDEALSLNSDLGISRRSDRLLINFDYEPFYLLYRQFGQYDHLNHFANLNLNVRLTQRFILALHNTFSYQEGAYPTLVGQQLTAGPASPTGLNQTIFPYTTRTLSNTPGLDLTFVRSRRTSFTLSGGYNQLKFSNHGLVAGPNLYNATGMSGGLQYQYRMTEHTTFGVLALHQDTTYQGGQILGNRLRFQIESAYVFLASRLAPSVTVSINGGPQYFRTLGTSLAGTSIPGKVQGAVGGSITKEVRKSAVNLTVQRSVTDGGGYYTSLINTSSTLGVRRRMVGQWDANIHGGAGRADTSLFELATGKTDSVTAGVDFIRPMRGGDVLHVAFDTTHQTSKGNLAVAANFDRNQVTVTYDFRLKAIPFGR